MTRKALIGFVLLFGAVNSRADFFVGPGGTGFNSLKIPMSARAVALGGAFTGASGDITSLEYNPAGMCGIEQTDINATFVRYLEDASLQNLSAGFPFVFRRSRARSSQFGMESDRAIIGVQYRLFKANDTARNDIGLNTGEFLVRDQVIGLGAAYAPFDSLGVGFTGKFISSKIQEESLNTYALDAGMLYKFSPKLQAGASILNIGKARAYMDTVEALPTTMRAGITFRQKSLGLLGDVAYGKDKILHKSAGVEFAINRSLILRGGLLHHNELEVSGGIGVRLNPPTQMSSTERDRKARKKILDDMEISQENPVYKKNTISNNERNKPLEFGFDYAFRLYNELGLTHTITFKILY